ncbi:MAG: histidine kinase [Chloroflexota bacterium]
MTRPREPQATDGGSAPDTPAAWLDEPRPAGAWRAGWFVASTAFLLYPVVHVLSIPAAPLEAALAIAAVLIFGSVLVRALLVDDGRIGLTGPLIVVQVLALLCIAAVLAAGWPDAGWSPIGYFASVSAGGVLPERRALRLLALCGGLMAIAMLIGGANPGDALLSGIGITVIGFVVFALNGLRRTNQALLRARADLARMAVLEERERIARDLHDTLGHSLSLITLKSELARRLLPDDPPPPGARSARSRTRRGRRWRRCARRCGGFVGPRSMASSRAWWRRSGRPASTRRSSARPTGSRDRPTRSSPGRSARASPTSCATVTRPAARSASAGTATTHSRRWWTTAWGMASRGPPGRACHRVRRSRGRRAPTARGSWGSPSASRTRAARWSPGRCQAVAIGSGSPSP